MCVIKEFVVFALILKVLKELIIKLWGFNNGLSSLINYIV